MACIETHFWCSLYLQLSPSPVFWYPMTTVNVLYHVRHRYSFTYFAGAAPPLWSSGQSSWLQIQMPGFDSQRYQIF
jgi:hypothetical protein